MCEATPNDRLKPTDSPVLLICGNLRIPILGLFWVTMLIFSKSHKLYKKMCEEGSIVEHINLRSNQRAAWRASLGNAKVNY